MTDQIAALLEVPFSEKNQVKALGARWSPGARKWYVPQGVSLTPFARWISGMEETTQTDLLAEATKDPRAKGSDAQDGQKGRRLSEFMQAVSLAVRKALPQSYWIQAEISEFRARNGNVYLSLVDRDENGKELAKVNGRMWGRDAQRVMERFKQATGGDLRPGIKILLKARAELHVQFGFSLSIDDIDPSYTLGDMERNLQEMRQALKAEGVFDRQRGLPSPWDFFRIAVISPDNAAGLGDFKQEADGLESHGLTQFVYYTARFQGNQAPREIMGALQRALHDHEDQSFDAVAIIRGGGAKTDLDWLNDLALARAVCASPIPVLTGIGHERDDTILDEVANTRFDTPSKVAAHVLRTVTTNGNTAIEHMVRILTQARTTMRQAAERQESLMREVITVAGHRLNQAAERLDREHERVRENAWQAIERVEQNTEVLFAEVIGLDPKSVLKRGYAIVRTGSQGDVVASRDQAAQRDMLTVEFRDGDLPVKVDHKTRQPSDPAGPADEAVPPVQARLI